MTRRRFLRLVASAGGVGLSTGLYTWQWEPHWIEVVERNLAIRKLPAELTNARMVQLSDLHIGPTVDDFYLLRVFQIVKDLAPEIVVYTGDFTSYAPDVFQHTRRVFRQLPLGSLGTFGILGNHDYGPAWQTYSVADGIAELAIEAGVRVLCNEVAIINGLQIAGLDDLWADRFNPARGLAALQPDRPAVVLSHNPDTADLLVWGTYAGWILSGHTHGGQCKAPFLPPPLLPVENRRYTSGEFALSGGRQMYINRGVGHLLQVRFNVRPEITVFHLRSA